MFQRNTPRRSTSGSLSRYAVLSHFLRSSSRRKAMSKDESAELRDKSSADSAFNRETRLRCSTGSIDHHMRDKCNVCYFIVKSRDRVRIGQLTYHQQCFKCIMCDVELNPKIYRDRPKKGMEDQLLCDVHRKPMTGKEPETLDLFDLIARTQNSRIDDQRCELPGFIQKSHSVSQLSQLSPVKSDDERVKEMLQRNGPYPQVLQPSSGGYWVEGFVEQIQSDSDRMLRTMTEADAVNYELTRSDAVNYYREYCMGQEHQNYLAQDDLLGPIIVSVKSEIRENVGKLYRTIVRTKSGTCHELIRSEDMSEPSICALTKLCKEDVTTNRFYPVTTLEASRLICEFDDRFLNRNFKFGVIHQARGQTTEEEFFGNNKTTPAFKEFLEVIGEKVNLKGFDRFRGGLDTVKGQTGTESIHTEFEGREIMFHVSTMLPYSDGDSQQLQRKRHIGNDIVAVVFQEENTPFLPNAIASQFLHAYLIVQPVESCSNKTRYKISLAARTDVPKDFGPALAKPKVIRKEQIREYLLTKLLNAEYACHSAPQFQHKMERTRSAYLSELYDELLKSTLTAWCGLTSTSTNEKSALSVFDSFKRMALKKIIEVPSHKKQNSVSSEGAKTPTSEHKIRKLPYSDKKIYSGNGLSANSWDRTNSTRSAGWTETTSLSSFRSQGSYRTETDSSSAQSQSPNEHTRNIPPVRINGRSSSPTSLGSYGDDDSFNMHDHDSDTGIGSLSPAETPNNTWESRLPGSKSFPNSDCNRCNSCDPDLDYIALLKKEILDLRKMKSHFNNELTAMKVEIGEYSRKENINRSELREKTKQNLRLQHQIDELRQQSQTYRNELSRLQALLAGIDGEEIV